MIKLAFLGTDDYAVKALDTLISRGLVFQLVVSTPNKPAGRGLKLTPPPIVKYAQEHHLTVIQPDNLKTVSIELAAGDWDVFIVASYGKIIPTAILSLPTHGTLNIHPSLLPKYRGPSPLESVILAGEVETGITILQVDAELDHGPIIAQDRMVLTTETAGELGYILFKRGAEIIADILPDYLADKIIPQNQDHTQATFTKKFEKNEAEINLADNPMTNYQKIRAFTPRPGAFTFVSKNGKTIRLKIIKAHLLPGELVLDRVIPEGKRETSWQEFNQ
ncbi:MAG: methionyl-tRNA formyltransferase [Candidatus Vogelbacteria bacterium]|nr:methionyl-tRNA formyltransferase [Candidatus Vogelbacteria bacterium]